MKSLFKNLRFKNLWEIGCPSNPISTSTKNSSKREKLIRWLASPVSLTLLLSQFSIVVPVKPAIADTTGSICAVPGKDGTTNQQQIVNTYFPGRPNTTVATGATSITLGSYHTGGANVPISPGDMLMVVQMQDAIIDSSNTNKYGSGNSANDGTLLLVVWGELCL